LHQSRDHLETISRTRTPHAHRLHPDIQAPLTSTGSNPLPTNLALSLKLRPVSFDRRHSFVFAISRHVSLRMSSHQALQYSLLPSLSHPRTSPPTLLSYLRDLLSLGSSARYPPPALFACASPVLPTCHLSPALFAGFSSIRRPSLTHSALIASSVRRLYLICSS
jgi:hypothetical protein